MFAADDRVLEFPAVCERPAPEVLYLCAYKVDKAKLAARERPKSD